MNSRSNFSGINRRDFLKASAIAAISTTLFTTRAQLGTASAQAGASDIDILNYALTLEHLESRAYQDVTNIGLLSGPAQTYFVEFGNQEAAHVVALTSTIQQLGGQPVRAQQNYNWPTFANESEVLDYFYMLEELGAAAYLGQATRIQNPDILTAAVSIHNVEGQHAAVLADLTGREPSPAFAEAKTMQQVLGVITPLLQSDMPRQMPGTGLGGRTNRQSLPSAR